MPLFAIKGNFLVGIRITIYIPPFLSSYLTTTFYYDNWFSLPVGSLLLYAGSSPPSTDWALSKGQILSVIDHPILFTALSNAFGGNGLSTFALPDLQGRHPIGAGRGRNSVSNTP